VEQPIHTGFVMFYIYFINLILLLLTILQISILDTDSIYRKIRAHCNGRCEDIERRYFTKKAIFKILVTMFISPFPSSSPKNMK
jgi:hypothetical protein